MIKCYWCGKFMSTWKNANFVFTPDTAFSVEESYWEHINCK